LRDVLGLFTTGVAVATASNKDGSRCGITINSFASVSLDPPLVLFSVDSSLRSFTAFEHADGFAINFLCSEQMHLSVRFASRGRDKWTGLDCHPGRYGGVILEGTLATLDCRTYAKYRAGDHLILLGEVVDATSRGAQAPLLFFAGAYRELGPTLIPGAQLLHESQSNVL
jgi:3-hydroxy-9,10-secoandrosta-1,3,5(10)-triene-9,17-dione monooxygenase reductase component